MIEKVLFGTQLSHGRPGGIWVLRRAACFFLLNLGSTGQAAETICELRGQSFQLPTRRLTCSQRSKSRFRGNLTQAAKFLPHGIGCLALFPTDHFGADLLAGRIVNKPIQRVHDRSWQTGTPSLVARVADLIIEPVPIGGAVGRQVGGFTFPALLTRELFQRLLKIGNPMGSFDCLQVLFRLLHLVAFIISDLDVADAAEILHGHRRRSQFRGQHGIPFPTLFLEAGDVPHAFGDGIQFCRAIAIRVGIAAIGRLLDLPQSLIGALHLARGRFAQSQQGSLRTIRRDELFLGQGTQCHLRRTHLLLHRLGWRQHLLLRIRISCHPFQSLPRRIHVLVRTGHLARRIPRGRILAKLGQHLFTLGDLCGGFGLTAGQPSPDIGIRVHILLRLAHNLILPLGQLIEILGRRTGLLAQLQGLVGSPKFRNLTRQGSGRLRHLGKVAIVSFAELCRFRRDRRQQRMARVTQAFTDHAQASAFPAGGGSPHGVGQLAIGHLRQSIHLAGGGLNARRHLASGDLVSLPELRDVLTTHAPLQSGRGLGHCGQSFAHTVPPNKLLGFRRGDRGIANHQLHGIRLGDVALHIGRDDLRPHPIALVQIHEDEIPSPLQGGVGGIGNHEGKLTPFAAVHLIGLQHAGQSDVVLRAATDLQALVDRHHGLRFRGRQPHLGQAIRPRLDFILGRELVLEAGFLANEIHLIGRVIGQHQFGLDQVRSNGGQIHDVGLRLVSDDQFAGAHFLVDLHPQLHASTLQRRQVAVRFANGMRLLSGIFRILKLLFVVLDVRPRLGRQGKNLGRAVPCPYPKADILRTDRQFAGVGSIPHGDHGALALRIFIPRLQENRVRPRTDGLDHHLDLISHGQPLGVRTGFDQFHLHP